MSPQDIEQFLEKWKLDQKDFAALFGMPQNTVSRFLNGVRVIRPYYSKSFYYFSLLSERQQKKEIDAVKEKDMFYFWRIENANGETYYMKSSIFTTSPTIPEGGKREEITEREYIQGGKG